MIRVLHLAATPVFVVMALATGVLDHGAANALCSAAAGAWLGGMAPMYLLMAVFHSSPWLKLIARPADMTPFMTLDRSSDIQTMMEQKP